MKYPYDIISYVRTKTFSIESRLYRETEESPLKVFNHFSRFVATIIQEGKAISCNIHLEHLSEIKRISEWAYNKSIDLKLNANTDTGNSSPAYTERFNTGNLKGMTPVEVLMKVANGKEQLRDQYSFLKSNLDKYPGNQKMMDAIKDAAQLSAEELKNSTNSAVSIAPVIIYELGCRPKIRKKRQDGKCPCYECKVVWDFSKNYPVSFVIKNYFAPVEKRENGTVNVILKQKDSEQIHEFSMTAAEWLNAIDSMVMAKETYYMLNFNKALGIIEQEENRRKGNDT